MRRLLLTACCGAALIRAAFGAVLENDQFAVSLDNGSQRLVVIDQRNRLRWKQVGLPSPVVFSVPILSGRPTLDGRLRGWDESSAIRTGKGGSRFVLNGSLERRELYLHAEVSNVWKKDSELEIWIGDSQVKLVLDASGTLKLVGEKYYEPVKEPHLIAETSGNSCIFQAILPMENFNSLNDWNPDQRFVAVAFNVKNSNGGFAERWPDGNRADDLWSFAQAAVDGDQRSVESLKLFDPKIRNSKLETNCLSFDTVLCAMSRAGAVQIPARIKLSLTGSGVEQKISPAPTSAVLHDLIWPCAFVLDEKESWTIYPNDSGMIVPTAVNHPQAVHEAWVYDGLIYDFNGTTCACMGMVDRSSEDGPGFLSIVEPPWTAHYRSRNMAVNGVQYRVPFYYWFANQGHLEKEYTLTHCFVENGSYSALAKQYRGYLQEHGRLKTFQEKLEEQPLNERVIGAPVFWLYSAMGPSAFVKMAGQMKADGMDKAILNLDPYYYETLGLHDYAKQMGNAIAQITNRGYIVSRYDQYRDTHPKASGRSVYAQWNTSVYDRYAEDYRGDKIAGFGQEARVITPTVAVQVAEKNVAEDLARYPYNARFFDCFGIISPYLDSDFRSGQETGVESVQECRKKIFGTATSRGLLAGSEGGADWSLPLISWAEGAMSLMPATWGEVPWWGANDENGHYKYEVNESIRIPFLQLVAGDCAAFSWRWEDGMDRKPQYWQKRNLFSVLYGGSPMFFINQDGYGALRPLIKYTYDYVCRWNQQIGDKEMLYHRSLTPDRTVQESCWQDGASRRGVVVNFGENAYRSGTLDVPPMDYRIFEESDGKRTCSAPPVPARNCDYRVVEFERVSEDFEQGFAYSLRSDFSPDRAQFCGAVSNAADVIRGQYSMVADNRNPKMPPFLFLQTRSSLVPLKTGRSYELGFTYRVLRPGGTLVCRISDREVFRPRTVNVGESEPVTISVKPEAAGETLKWFLIGTGRVAVDDIRIEQTGK